MLPLRGVRQFLETVKRMRHRLLPVFPEPERTLQKMLFQLAPMEVQTLVQALLLVRDLGLPLVEQEREKEAVVSEELW